MTENPLVSVFVVTYNSEDTVLETLDSIKAQTYKNIELIISDDNSNDKTVEVCEQWTIENQHEFVRIEIITSFENTGTAANVNRAIRKCQGEWIKGIAGDDKLVKTCLVDNIEYVYKNSEINVLFSLCQGFKGNSLIGDGHILDEDKAFYMLSPTEQYEYLIKHPSPTNLASSLFCKSEIIKKYPYDERIPFQEDYPKWIDFTRHGIKLYLMEKITILYRYGDSLSNSYNKICNPLFVESQMLHFYLERKKQLRQRGYFDIIKEEELRFFTYYFGLIVLKNKRNLLTRILRRLFAMIVRVF